MKQLERNDALSLGEQQFDDNDSLAQDCHMEVTQHFSRAENKGSVSPEFHIQQKYLSEIKVK